MAQSAAMQVILIAKVDVAGLKEISKEVTPARKNILGYTLENGNKIYIIAEGRLVNLAAGDGHPAEIMDMSFALQAQSARYIASQKERLPVDVYQTPEVIDNRVAEILLETKKLNYDRLTEEQYRYINSWDF